MCFPTPLHHFSSPCSYEGPPSFDLSRVIERLKLQERRHPWLEAMDQGWRRRLTQILQTSDHQLDPWERVLISRHPQRPKGLELILRITEDFQELSGDRLLGEDAALVGGLGWINKQKWVILAQEKGQSLETRVRRNFGMMQPQGYRKAMRLMELAERFHLPVLSIIDTPGAYPGLEAEERGQAWAIATNLQKMSQLRTPILALILGEGCSGGALGIGVADSIGILHHAYYSVISPEGCASILWRDVQERQRASRALKLTAEELLLLGIVDDIIPEGSGGAHHDPGVMAAEVVDWCTTWREQLARYELNELLERRYEKFRKIGSLES